MRKNFYLLIISTGLSLIFAEVILRLVYSDLPIESWGKEAFCRNNVIGRIMKPNVDFLQFTEEFDAIPTSSNSQGYRDIEWEQKDGKKIMILGDSFGWGWGCPINNTIVYQLDSILEGYSTFNFSIPGDDLSSMYKRFLYYEEELKPDAVIILNYFNDFFDVERQRKVVDEFLLKEYNYLKKVECQKFYQVDFRDVLNKIYLYRLINRIRSQGGISFSSKKAVENAIKKGFEKDIALLKDEQQQRKALDFYFELLKSINHKYPLLVVNIPTEYQIDVNKYNELNELLNLDEVQVDSFEDKFRQKCLEENIDYLSLRDTLLIANPVKRTYFHHDSHLNSFGQSISGTYLANKILENVSFSRISKSELNKLSVVVEDHLGLNPSKGLKWMPLFIKPFIGERIKQ